MLPYFTVLGSLSVPGELSCINYDTINPFAREWIYKGVLGARGPLGPWIHDSVGKADSH